MTHTPNSPTLNIPEQDLPVWMRRALRRNDYGALFTLLVSLLISWSFILAPNIATNNALQAYVYQIGDYAQSFSAGHLYPRWAAHALSGYGAPIYHYQPPLPSYLGGLLTVFATQDALISVRILIVLSYLLAGSGVYGLLVRTYGAAEAFLAAILYISSPFLGQLVPHILGDLRILMGMGILPHVLWHFDRTYHWRRTQDFVLLSLTFAALLLTHVALALSALMLCLLMLFLEHLRRAEPREKRYARWSLRGLAIGILLAGFYLLPLALEYGAVNWQTFHAGSRPLFVSLQTLLSPYRPADPAALIADAPLTLGWLRNLLFVLALGVLAGTKSARYTSASAMAVGAWVCIGLMLWVLPSQIWLLGVLTFCTSMVIPMLLRLRQRLSQLWQRWVLILGLMLTLGASHPTWLPVQPATAPLEATPLAQLQHEQRGYGVAVVPSGSLYPSTLPQNYRPNQTLINTYQNAEINRSDPSALSRNIQISLLSQSNQRARFQVFARSNQRVTWLLAAFEGWRARLDGRTLQTYAHPESGLLEVEIPSTTSQQLTIELAPTPIRIIGWLVSVGAFCLLMAFVWYIERDSTPQYHDIERLTLAESRLLGSVLGLGFVVLLLTAMPNSPLMLRATPNSQLVGVIPLEMRTTTGITLLGYRLHSPSTLRPNEALDFTLYWTTLYQLQQNYIVQVALHNTNRDVSYNKANPRYAGGYPTSRWQAQFYISDPHRLTLPPDLPAGTYQLTVTISACPPQSTSCNLQPVFFSSIGERIGKQVTLPITLQIVR